MCREIRCICPSLSLVLVTQENNYIKLLEICNEFEWDYVQLHFRTTPEDVLNFKKSLAMNNLTPKLIAVFESKNLQEALLKDMAKVVDYLLFDTSMIGGTGMPVTKEDYEQIPEEASGIPYFIAGGLKPETVKSVIEWSQPYAVDVQSGVAFAPPRKHEKDPALIHKFILEALGKQV